MKYKYIYIYIEIQHFVFQPPLTQTQFDNFVFRNTVFDQNSVFHILSELRGGDNTPRDRQTDGHHTYILNWPRGRLSEIVAYLEKRFWLLLMCWWPNSRVPSVTQPGGIQ